VSNPQKNRHLGKSLCAASTVVALSFACRHTTPTLESTSAAPAVSPQAPQLSPPNNLTIPAPPLPGSRTTTSVEEHVTIDTHGAEIDVRQALGFIASRSGFSLVYSPEINKKVRLQLIDVPVSEALQAVLSVAGLTLESTTPKAKAPTSSSVVFYELPVNVDSLSAEAIMKRFGVGRAIAELLVQNRPDKP
jgi:hypothetical protein